MNWAVFRTRALTALVFVAVMLLGLFWNRWSFFLLFSVVHFGCWVEYTRLIANIYPSYAGISPFHKYGVMLTGWSFMLYNMGDGYEIAGIPLSSIGLTAGLVFAFALPVTEVLFSRQFNFSHIRYSVLGLLYISLSWGLFIYIRSLEGRWTAGNGNMYETGLLIPVILVFSIWINDTMAYITGSFIGKTPFSKISPKKTIEGTVGGAVLCVAAMGTAAWLMKLPVVPVCMIAGIAATAGTAGDLVESKIKRLAGVKDSGQFMPGHGGFLDRFDSLLLAIPFTWIYVMLLL